MNRFDKNSRFLNFITKCKLSLIFTIIVLIFCLIGIHSVDNSTTQKQLESLENAVYRGVVQCYALEGTYPPNLDYLKEHYGLTYDTEKYFVDYQIFSSNMMPDITIIPIHQSKDKSNISLPTFMEGSVDE